MAIVVMTVSSLTSRSIMAIVAILVWLLWHSCGFPDKSKFFEMPPGVNISAIFYNGSQWEIFSQKKNCKNHKHRVLDNKLK